MSVPAAPSADAATIALYRDDGPLAVALGRALGRRAPGAALAWGVAALLPGLAVAAATGDDTPHGVLVAAVAWAVLAGGVASGRPITGAVRWTIPPVMRAIEFGGLLWIAAVAGPSSLPAVFALLCVLAYHHYDTVYGGRHRGAAPAPRVQVAAGGWDGRLVAATAALLAGALPAAFFVAAAVLAVAFLTVTVVEWRRVGLAGSTAPAPALAAEDEELAAG